MTTAELVIRVGREALFLALLLSAPMVLASLVVGLVVGVIQAATQVQESTLSVAPKLVAVMLALAAFAPWIGRRLGAFTESLMLLIPRLSG